MKSTPRSAPPRAGKPRGTQGHFFTAPVTPAGVRVVRPARPARPTKPLRPARSPGGSGASSAWSAARPERQERSPQPPRPPRSAQTQPPRDALAQRARPARAQAWDDGDDDSATPSYTVARGTKVRSRRPTGAQELRAQMLRVEARAQEAQRAPRQAVARARIEPAGARPARVPARVAVHVPARIPARIPARAPARAPAREAAARAVKPRAATAAPARALPPPIDFLLHGEHIALDNLLKLTGLAPSGGAAKALAAAGAVRVDGQVELRKTCKIRVGQLVQLAEARIRVVAAQ